MKRFIKTGGILFSALLVVGICTCMADFPTMASAEKKMEAIEKADNKTAAIEEKKILTEEEKKKEKIKILDPDGTLGLEIVEEGKVKDGEYTIVTASYKVDSEKKNKILWERLKKYRKQLDMLEGGGTDEDAIVEEGTSEKVKE